METPIEEASTQVAEESETPETEQSEESVVDETSEDGTQEDADPLKKAISDKDRHIGKLEDELRDERSKKKPTDKAEVSEDNEGANLWMITHADQLKLVAKEYQKELNFYKEHKITITNELRDRALRDARSTKGLDSKNTEGSDRQEETSSESQGETRDVKSDEIPPKIFKLIKDATGKDPTKEDYNRWKKDLEAKKKKNR